MPIASVLSAVDGMKTSRAGDAALMRFQGDVIDTVCVGSSGVVSNGGGEGEISW